MYKNNVYVSLIVITLFIILLLLISIHYSIGLAQTNDNPDLASFKKKGDDLYDQGKYEEAIVYYDKA